MIDTHSEFITFLNKYLKNDIDNFVTVTVVQTRTDPVSGECRLVVEVCMDKDYKSQEFTSFQLLDRITKYSSLFSIYGTPTINVIKLA
jgi:hypothetical protein